MEKKLWRLLAAFFMVMIVFTVVSRAAASVMVAKVQVASAKEGELVYELTGTGTVKENGEKYIDLQQGYKIGEVHVEKGQSVNEGDILFYYDLDQLEEKKVLLDKELKRMEMEYEKAGLNNQKLDGASSVEVAERNLQAAKESLDRAEREVESKKEDIIKAKKEAYKEAVSAYNTVVTDKQIEENKAARVVSDAIRALNEVNRPLIKLKEVSENFKEAVYTGNEETIEKATTQVFDFYYNGAYKEHLEEKTKAEEEVKRATQDLETINKRWEKSIDDWDQFSSDEDEQRNYYIQLANKEAEVRSAARVLEDAQKKLNSLSEPDTKISNALYTYRTALQDNNRDLEAAYYPLYQILYENIKIDETKLKEATITYERAQEDERVLIEQWDKKEKEAKEKVDKLEADIKKIEDGTYDYEDELKDVIKAVEQAEKELENAITNQEVTESNDVIQDKINVLDQNMSKLEIDSKKEEIKKLKEIIDNKGAVVAPIAGFITKNDLAQGNILSGNEKLTIATGGYELVMTANKDDVKHFSVGDEIEIKAGNGYDRITSNIENIELPDGEGNVKFTALLPEGGDYREGNSLDYEIKKESESFPYCIPIQALREDSNGTFILLVKEKDSVLGKEETAFRLSVTVTDKDEKTAAIIASLSKEDLIITSSNKNISEGDRVRVYEVD